MIEGLTKTIDLDGRQVTVRELNVSEVRAWLLDAERSEDDIQDIVGESLMDECSLRDLPRMTDLDLDALNHMPPSRIDTVIAACKEINPHFFALRARLLTLGQAVLDKDASN